MDFRMSEICKHCKLGDFANFQVIPPLLSFMKFVNIVIFQVFPCDSWKSARILSASQAIPIARIRSGRLSSPWGHVQSCSRSLIIAFYGVRTRDHGMWKSRYTIAPPEVCRYLQGSGGEFAFGFVVLGGYGGFWQFREIPVFEICLGENEITEIYCGF